MNKNAVKMTRATAIAYCLSLDAVQSNTEVATVLDTMLTQLNKPRVKGERKVNPETQERRERVLSTLSTATEPLTCTQTAELAGISQAQANAAIKSLIDAQVVKREVVKRVAYFSIVE